MPRPSLSTPSSWKCGIARRGYQGMLQRETTIPAYYRVELEQAGKSVVQLYRDWGKPAQAVEWREKLLATNGSAFSVRP